ncbi:ATP-binding protein [uncultured Caulobacter sp.]|uniref:hybrid sensor histidine kinase/response regulator n=1 Tax=uncultured Caulobacter sp. TaxID=158749 RepID=UPI002635B87D|nr:ATP-binding protein [uncultured Caulobacter sp.]
MLAERRPKEISTDGALLAKALDAQAALLPYALGVFAISLPVFVWVASFAANAVWMTASFLIFAVNWGAFYAAVNWLRDNGSRDLNRRARAHVMCGVLWALTVMQISAFAQGAGPARDTLLMLATAGAVLCAFFSAPYLPALLIVAPLAAAGPLIAQFSVPESRQAAEVTWGALALSLTLALILNRMFRRQHDLAVAHEQLVDERLRVLEAAERTARSKSDIVATLSHEIRNGLTGVTHVLAAAAGRGGRAAPSREQLNAALDAAQDLISVLNATLDSETAEAGRLQVDCQPFDPVRLVQDLTLLDKPHAAAKGLELSVHVDPLLRARDRGAVIADALRTRQIIANLLGNAVKYTVRGRVEIRVELREGVVAIEIADTGPGLSTDEIEQAFEPFRRVERTGAGVNGAGLGLSLSRQLARLMGGALEARSAVGVGSCFTLTLPYDPAAACELEEEAFEALVSDPPGAPRSLRILIAEDDALNAAMLRAVLEQLGHQVVHAQNGRRAADLAHIAEFDLLMLDHRMPVMDGPAAAAALRASAGPNQSAPIVAIIDGDGEEASGFLDAGADLVLRKPVSVAGVARALADAAALDRRETAKTVAA